MKPRSLSLFEKSIYFHNGTVLYFYGPLEIKKNIQNNRLLNV